MKKDVLQKSKLYVITGPSNSKSLSAAEITRKAIQAGASLIQLRCKTINSRDFLQLAKIVRSEVNSSEALFIVNDDPNIARLSDADGVHVGQDDLSVDDARTIIGNDCIVGKSTHSVDQATSAENEGADYIGFGPIFSTPTKPEYGCIGHDYLQKVNQMIKIPVFAIGGINLENAKDVMEFGAQRIAMVRAICEAENIGEAVASALNIIMSEGVYEKR